MKGRKGEIISFRIRNLSEEKGKRMKRDLHRRREKNSDPTFIGEEMGRTMESD